MKKIRFRVLCLSVAVLLLFYAVKIRNDLVERYGTGENAEPRIMALSHSDLEAESAIVIDGDSGKVLFDKNADKKMYPASTTKIMTALLALKYGDLDEEVKIGDEVGLLLPDASKAGLEYGESMTLEHLLEALMLPSGNDAANTIAVHIAKKVSGDETMERSEALPYFRELMNEEAKALGANNTHFVNAHGYPNEDHYTSACDLALIALEAMKYSSFRDTVKLTYAETGSVSVAAGGAGRDNEGEGTHSWMNTNKLLIKDSGFYYENATGIKTGYTSAAGYCLVASAEKDGRSVIAVLLNSTEQGQRSDAVKLLKKALNK